MTRVGDLALQAADQLQQEHLEAIDDPEKFLDDEQVMIRDLKKGLFAKIQFRWRKDDEKILAQIREGVDTLFREMFDEAVAIMDRLYAELRVPVTVEGIVQRDADGRMIWKKDSKGEVIEDWSQLTGQDLEKTLLDLTRLKLILAPQANDLLLEAIFAKHVFDDKAHHAYSSLLDGTVKDREAYASREAKPDKYFAFFKFYLYSHAEVFMKELNNFARVLERIRYWRIDDGGKVSP